MSALALSLHVTQSLYATWPGNTDAQARLFSIAARIIAGE
jgi:hypothetical protein